MKGFMIKDGDLVITNKDIEYAYTKELIMQTIQTILSTNKGEWLFDEEEGIEFENVLGKHVDESIVKSEIEQALKQVDDSLTLDSISFKYNENTRKMAVNFTAKSSSGDTVEVSNVIWG